MWWYLKVSGIEPGETITLEVGDAPWATPERAVVSTDNNTWRHTEPGEPKGNHRVYHCRVDATEAWFAWGPPFTTRDAEALVDRVAREYAAATAFELCRSREGRPTPALRVAEGEPGERRFGVWVVARQHAWESGASWVCRGFTEWLVSDDPRAAALRRKASVTIVPVVDVDNVALGAGGKGQSPRDHNRDWTDDPHFPAVAAMIEAITAADAERRFHVFVDLHNPGANDKSPFFYFPPPEEVAPFGHRNYRHFFRAAQAELVEPMRLEERPRISGPNYDKLWRQIAKNWIVANTAPYVVATTLETPWNTPQSTTEGYQTVGRQLGLAIERYFRSDPTEPPAAPERPPISDSTK